MLSQVEERAVMSTSVDQVPGTSGRRVVVLMLVAVAVVAAIALVGMIVAAATNGPGHRPAPSVNVTG